MPDVKKNLSSALSNPRSRIFILILLVVGIGALSFGLVNLFSSDVNVDEEGSALSRAPAIESIPGSVNPTEQYAKLQAQQNVQKAEKAKATGGSSIPTIIRTEKFGEGNAPIGLKEGEGGVGFSTLSLGGEGGRTKTWLDDLKTSQCAKNSVDFAISKGATTEQLLTGCSCIQLKAYGFKLADLVKGCKCKSLKEAGYTAKELKQEGNYTARQLRLCGYSACEMKAAGFSASELKAAGYTDGELKGAGFSEDEIRAAEGLPPGISVDDLKKAGCTPSALRKLREQGVSASSIRRISGCSIDQLKAAGFSATELKNAGFTAAELRAAGFSAKDLKDAGFSVEELKAAGFSAKDLKDAGFSAAELKAAGFSATELKGAGFSDSELKSAGFSDSEIEAAKAALAAAAGLPPGVSLEDVRKAGCNPESLRKLKAKGVTAEAIRKISGCSVKQLKAAGFSAKELKDAGFTAAELKAAGFNARELQAAGFSAKELKDAGFSAAELKSAGFSARDLRDAGFSAAELKDAGFSAAELKNAGFSARELKDAGFSASELKAAGYSAAALKSAGFSAEELKSAGFSAEELKSAGFSAEELKAAGFSAEDLKAAGFSAEDLKAAGFSDEELAKAGFSDSGKDDEFAFIKDEELKKALAASKKKRNKIELEGQLKKIQGRMKAYAAKVEKSWIVADQEFVSDEEDEDLAGGLGGGLGSIAGAAKKTKPKDKAGDGLEEQEVRPAMIKAGDIHFAVLETSVNTDEPAPVLARIAQGRFKDSKLIGSVELPSNGEKAILKFTTMSIPGANNTISIDSVAIDLNTARTALSSRTDNHYFTRYGSLLASSFLEGFGKAITGVQTQINTTGGAVSTQQAASTTGEALYAALGQVGSSWGEAIGEYTNKPATVHIYSGIGMGILFLQDVPPID
ncbi:MAG: pentapeptide repeat-containing protein [Legionellales bacterium]|nr:pentapeptide repeat-containing protein [Legionellales bacterium]